MNKQHILHEIKRTAEANGGIPWQAPILPRNWDQGIGLEGKILGALERRRQ